MVDDEGAEVLEHVGEVGDALGDVADLLVAPLEV